MTKKVASLLPQNLSIISWAFAKLGLLNEVCICDIHNIWWYYFIIVIAIIMSSTLLLV